jgi:hypothetical protein
MAGVFASSFIWQIILAPVISKFVLMCSGKRELLSGVQNCIVLHS